MVCAPMLGQAIPAGVEVAVQKCPKCGRELQFDVSNEREEAQENLKRFARAVASVRDLPVNLFTITVNGSVIVDDPPCVCTSACEHCRMELTLNPNAVEEECIRLLNVEK